MLNTFAPVEMRAVLNDDGGDVVPGSAEEGILAVRGPPPARIPR